VLQTDLQKVRSLFAGELEERHELGDGESEAVCDGVGVHFGGDAFVEFCEEVEAGGEEEVGLVVL